MDEKKSGILAVLFAVVIWSFGGAVARSISSDDIWTILFWRSTWAALFLLTYLLFRYGRQGTARLFRTMGVAGGAVALCLASGATCYVVALSFTTVANILLIQAGVPLIAALISWLVLGEKVSTATWVAIGVVILGIAVMVSGSLATRFSLVGNILALVLTIAYSFVILLLRRYSRVGMIPAACLGMTLAAGVAALLAGNLSVSPADMGLLFLFGALTFGFGLALFVSGAPQMPPAITALIGTLESVLGPIWVWLFHNEIPSLATVVGGGIVVLALVIHVLWRSQPQAVAVG